MGPTLLLLLFETAAPPLLAADAAAAACPRPPCVASWWGLRVCWHGGGWQGGRGGRHWGGRALLTVGKMSEGWGRLGQMAV